ncbi:MAG: HlyD family secretion protein [Proteobacteria bacterium]|nr:HlyD family secretion protein [Pseudomonadota bacterium]
MAQEKPVAEKKKKIIFIIFFILILLGGLSSYYIYKHSKTYVKTDNAYVKEDFTLISSKIDGTVISVYCKENDFVKKGTLLLEIDPKDYELKVEQARMAVYEARNRIAELKTKTKETDALIEIRKAELEKAETDLNRARKLYSKGLIPKEQLERTETYYKVANGNLNSALNQKETILAGIGKKIEGEEAVIKRNEKLLEEAKQYLSYSKIYAPMDGYITKKNVETGNVIGRGQPLMALVPMKDFYIEANFKETEVGKIKIGDRADIKIDIYPDLKLKGVVESISPGTGVVFSLLPPENATGNWIKVVQRIPVRIKIIDLPQDKKLRLGLSCEVKVYI